MLGSSFVLFGVMEQSDISSVVYPANEKPNHIENGHEKKKSGILDERCANKLDAGIRLANVESSKGELSRSQRLAHR